MTEERFKNQLRESMPVLEGSQKRTICEVHREIYDRLDELGLGDDPAIAMLEEAYALGKKMFAKLQQYGEKKTDEWYAGERARVLDDTLARRQARRKARREQREAREEQ